jgi:hypothetical protein
MKRRYRVIVTEEVSKGMNRFEYIQRNDLTRTVEGDVYSTAKRTFKRGFAEDPQFSGMQLCSLRVRDQNTLIALVRAARTGGVFKAKSQVRH